MSEVIELKQKPKARFYAVAPIEGGVERTPEFQSKDELMQHLTTSAPKKVWTICRIYGEPAKTRETITRLGY